METIIICSEENCLPISLSQLFADNRDHSINSNDYTKLEESHNDFEHYFRDNTARDAVKIEHEKIDEFGNTDEHFVSNGEQFVKSDEQFVKSDVQFGKIDEQFVNIGDNIGNDDFDHSDDESTFDDESSQEQAGDLECKVQSGEENQINYEYYEEERNECLNEIRNECGNEETAEESGK